MIKTTFLALALSAILFTACDRKPFVEHKLKFEKVADGCDNVSAQFGMTSNFGGERFQFQKCLAADFTKEQMTASRQGDTVVIRFPQPEAGKPGAVFAITLDIDSYPRYEKITIDNDTYALIPSNP